MEILDPLLSTSLELLCTQRYNSFMKNGHRDLAIHALLGGDRIIDHEVLSCRSTADFRLPRASLISLLDHITSSLDFPKPLLSKVATRIDIESTLLTKEASEATLRLAEGFHIAAIAMGDEQQAANFITSENPALGNQWPFMVLLDPDGIEAVSAVVANGVHGLPA